MAKIRYFHSRMGGRTFQAAILRGMAHEVYHSKPKKIQSWLKERMWKYQKILSEDGDGMYVTYSNHYSISIVVYTFEYLSIPSINQLWIFFGLLWYTPWAIPRNIAAWKVLPPILEWKYRIFDILTIVIFWRVTIRVLYASSWAERVNI